MTESKHKNKTKMTLFALFLMLCSLGFGYALFITFAPQQQKTIICAEKPCKGDQGLIYPVF